MKRQTRIGALGAAALMTLATACAGQAAQRHEVTRAVIAPPGATAEPSATGIPLPRTQSKPNILVVETDDMRWDELRWMPNVQRLVARTGLTFENSFAPYPLCAPSRASFLTGRYAHNHGVLSHEEPYGFASFDDHRTIATALQRQGYQTALVGKYINGYGEQPVHATTRPSLYYVPPGWSQWYAGSDHLWGPYDRFHGGTYDYFNLTQNIDGRLATFPGKYSTNVLGQQTRHVLGQFVAKRKPWFVWWTPVAPHHGDPVEPDDPGTTYNKLGLPVHWDTPARPDWVKGHFDRLIPHGLGTPPHHSAEADVHDKPAFLRHNPDLLPGEKDAERTVSRQRAEALFVLDGQIGKTIRYLKRSGQFSRTIIVFTSDNGYYLGEHRKRQGKINLHENSLRVPLLVTGPGVPHGVRYDPVTTVDLAPTFASYAGARLPGVDGSNLRPLIRNGDQGWDRAVVTEGRMPESTYLRDTGTGTFTSQLDTRGLRLGRWKLTVYSTGEVELYDLARDPLELRSLDKDPAHRGILRELMRLWRQRESCAGYACREPVPADLRVSAAEERVLTDRMFARTWDYFSDPALGNGPLLRH